MLPRHELRLVRLAASRPLRRVVLNALTALAWGGIAALQLTTALPLYAILSVVLVVMYTLTAWGFLKQSPSAYGRSFRVHAIGLLFDVAQVAMAHTFFYMPLAALHGLALLATWLARDEFFAPVTA